MLEGIEKVHQEALMRLGGRVSDLEDVAHTPRHNEGRSSYRDFWERCVIAGMKGDAKVIPVQAAELADRMLLELHRRNPVLMTSRDDYDFLFRINDVADAISQGLAKDCEIELETDERGKT